MFPNYFHKKLQWWAAIGQAAGDIGAGYLNYRSQSGANKTNVKLQQQDEAWQTQMSNTAVQRRADDIEKAGGNRALAFTNGQEASTPSIAPAHVDPVHFDSPHIASAIQASQMLRAQKDNLEAQTNKLSADTRSTNLDTDIREAGADYEVKYNVLGSAQDVANKTSLGNEIQARIGSTESDTLGKQIANYVAQHTIDDSIAAIKSGAILTELHIKPAELKSNWEELKDDVLKALLRHRKFTGSTTR